jgi:hypothetical protein
MNTKKILLYAGGALVLGGVSFFVWSFFQKPIVPFGNTTIVLGSSSNTTPNAVGSNTNDNVSTPPIVAENSHSTSNNDSILSGLDAFIRMGV